MVVLNELTFGLMTDAWSQLVQCTQWVMTALFARCDLLRPDLLFFYFQYRYQFLFSGIFGEEALIFFFGFICLGFVCFGFVVSLVRAN